MEQAYADAPNNYVFFSNYPKSPEFSDIEWPTEEHVIMDIRKRWPHIPREAILVQPHVTSPVFWSCYLAKEFKPEVEQFMAHFQNMKRIAELLFNDGSVQDFIKKYKKNLL